MFPLKRRDSKVEKSSKPKLKQSHTAFTTKGMGDYYGTGKKNSVGKMRSGSVGITPVSKKKLGTPPKSVV